MDNKKPALNAFLQIGIIVRNVDDSVKNWEAMNIGPWNIGALAAMGPATDLTMNGEPVGEGKVYAKNAFLRKYGFEIELIEPIADGPYKSWLDEHGPGIHHIAMLTEDDYDTVLKNYDEKTGGRPIFLRGQAMNNLMDFSYLDLREELGVIIECYRNQEPTKPVLDYDTKLISFEDYKKGE